MSSKNLIGIALVMLLAGCSATPDALPADPPPEQGLTGISEGDMPTGLPASLLRNPGLWNQGEAVRHPDGDKAQAGNEASGMYDSLQRCMTESGIGKRRLVIRAPRPMPDNAESLVYELVPATADVTVNATDLARFLAFIEHKASAGAVVTRIRLSRSRDDEPDADAWSPSRVEVTHFVGDSPASRSSALATWARLALAVGGSPSVRAGSDLTELDIAVEQGHTLIRASGTVANNEVYAELIRVASSLSASADVTPGAVQPGDSWVDFTALEVRLESDE